MFSRCPYLNYINFTGIDTSSLTLMSNMFTNSTALTSVDLSNLNLTSLKSMNNMFYGCTALDSVEFNNLSPPSEVKMSNMFYECYSLLSIDLSGFDTTVTSINHMFYKCSNLTSVDISHFETSPAKSMTQMFYQCSSLTSLDLSNLNTSSIISMDSMFYGCANLVSLELNSFSANSLTKMCQMFYGCRSLTSLNLNNFDTLKVSTFNEMFYGCKSLEILDISKFQISSTANIDNMFFNCNSSLIMCLDENNVDNSLVDFLSDLLNVYTIDCQQVRLAFNLTKKKFFGKDIYLSSCEEDLEYKYEYNNTCYKICPENTYYNKIKCIDIPEGYYLNDSILMSIDKCKEKCKICTNESTYLNLCISYNNDLSYYHILNNNSIINEQFIEWVRDIMEEYYLENNTYKPCYSKCKKCSRYGEEFQNNCDECKINYTFLNDTTDNNCYEECKFYYFFDESNKYFCTQNEECPIEFSKLIPEKRKCIQSCIQDNYYQYEFNNTCYKSCPDGTKPNTNICEIEQPSTIIENKNEFFTTDFIHDITNTYISDFTDEKFNLNDVSEDSDKIISDINTNISDFTDENFNLNDVSEDSDKIISDINTNISDFKDDESNIDSNLKNSEENSNDVNINNDNIISDNKEDISFQKNNECNSINFFNNKCEKNSYSLDEMISMIQNGISSDKSLLEIINKNNSKLIKKEDNAIYSVSRIDDQEDYSYNVTTIDIGECEDILREKYKLDYDDSLYIFKIEYYIEELFCPIVNMKYIVIKCKENWIWMFVKM